MLAGINDVQDRYMFLTGVTSFSQRETESLTGVVNGQEPCQDIWQFVVTRKSHCFDLFTISLVLYVQRRLCAKIFGELLCIKETINTLYFTCPELKLKRKLWQIFPKNLWLDL